MKVMLNKVPQTLIFGLIIAIFGYGIIWAISDSGYNWNEFPLFIIGLLAIIGILLIIEKIDIYNSKKH